MAKKLSIGKRAKISQAQQYVLLAVLGTAILLGATVALVKYFIDQISFNASVISKEDESIKAYTNFIKGVGICQKPSGDVYNDDDLAKCNPNSIDAASIPDTLRYNILEVMAANPSLNSVTRDAGSACINPDTGKNYTYSEMNKLYDNAANSEQRIAASAIIQSCSALRVIPDALPDQKNEEALLSSLNKIFNISDWEPESLAPSDSTGVSNFGSNLKTIAVRLSINASTATTVKVLDNIERSIREFSITRATISWAKNDTLDLQAQANAFYMSPSTVTETIKTIKPGDNKR